MAVIERNNNVIEEAGMITRTVAGAPVDGTSGTHAGKAPKGALLTDTTNGILYINTGTQASPTWVKVGTQT